MSENKNAMDKSGSSESRPGTSGNEGKYKNIETSVNNPEYFSDEVESSMENEISEDEARTEKEGRSEKGKS
ncbi:MAG: hypothetical protein ACJ75B_02240 [Flavisolibacter sp.]